MRNTLALSLFVPDYQEMEMMRVSAGDAIEQSISSVFVAIFDAHTGRRLYTTNNDSQPQIFDPLLSSGQRVTIDINENYKSSHLVAVAVANYQGEDKMYDSIPNLNKLNGAATLSAFRQLFEKVRRRSSETERTSKFFRSAEVSVEVTGAQSAVTISIPLKRQEAKVFFEINTDSEVRQTATFYPRAWRILNVAKKLQPFTIDDNNLQGSDYFPVTDDASSWNDFEMTPTGNTLSIPNQFVAYIPQNRLKCQKNITVDEYNKVSGEHKTAQEFAADKALAFYMRAHRTKQSKPDTYQVDNGSFDYAPQYATYIEVIGDWRQSGINGALNASSIRHANVKYTIPLGYANGNVDDYNVPANQFFKIKATVRGVDKIVAEVTTNNLEKNHNEYDANSEGNVFDANRIMEVDAHFCTALMKIRKSDLPDLADRKHIDYKVHSPFASEEHKDRGWVHFVLTKKADGRYKEELPDDLEKCAYNPTSKRFGKNNFPKSDQDRGQFYVDDLVEFLKQIPNDSPLWDNEGKLVFALMINEFYYDDNKDIDNTQLSSLYANDWEKNAWRLFVNQPNRTMSLFLDKQSMLVSADGKSSYQKPSHIISQRSIKTLTKNVENNSSLPYVDGFETIDEVYQNEGPQSAYPSDHTHAFQQWDYTYGGNMVKKINHSPYAKNEHYRMNITYGFRESLGIWNLISKYDDSDSPDFNSGRADKNWTIFKIVHGDHFRPGYNKAPLQPTSIQESTASVEYNCMSRNADLNGNGEVDLNEVRWYIPARKQMARMIQANHALPFQEQLLNTDFARQHPWFLIASASSHNEFAAMCVDEAFTISTFDYTFNECGSDWGVTTRNLYDYSSVRCVRNLGSTPQTIHQYEQENLLDPVYVHPLCATQAMNIQSGTDARNPASYYNNNTSSWHEIFTAPMNASNKGNVGIIIDLRHLKSNALRKTYLRSGEIPVLESGKQFPRQGSYYSLPYYKGFRVAVEPVSTGAIYGNNICLPYKDWYLRNDTGNQGNWKQYIQNCGHYTEKNHDGTITGGWRMPSSAELELMIEYIKWNGENDRRGWPQHGNMGKWTVFYGKYSKWGNRSYIAPICAADVCYEKDGTISNFVLVDTGYDTYIQMVKAKKIDSHIFKMRCVKDWDPDLGDKETYRDQF